MQLTNQATAQILDPNQKEEEESTSLKNRKIEIVNVYKLNFVGEIVKVGIFKIDLLAGEILDIIGQINKDQKKQMNLTRLKQELAKKENQEKKIKDLVIEKIMDFLPEKFQEFIGLKKLTTKSQEEISKEAKQFLLDAGIDPNKRVSEIKVEVDLKNLELSKAREYLFRKLEVIYKDRTMITEIIQKIIDYYARMQLTKLAQP